MTFSTAARVMGVLVRKRLFANGGGGVSTGPANVETVDRSGK
jgi:hypothetical protein